MKTVAELEARIKELEDAVEWALLNIIMPVPEFRVELRARAFTPQFEPVEVKRWECPFCTMAYHTDPYTIKPQIVLLNDCCNKARSEELYIILSGHYKRPIPTKVKRREELELDGFDERFIQLKRGNDLTPLNKKYYREWEE